MPGPERAASSSVARPISAAVGITPSAEAKKIDARARVRELEHDRDRDERDEQVRPAGPAEQEPAQVEALRRLGSRRRELYGQGKLDEPTVRAGRRTSAPWRCREPAAVTQSEYFLRSLGARAARSRSSEPEPDDPEPEEPRAAEAEPAELAEQLRRTAWRPRAPRSSWSSLRSSSWKSRLSVPDSRRCRCRARRRPCSRPCAAASSRPCRCRSRPRGP